MHIATKKIYIKEEEKGFESKRTVITLAQTVNPEVMIARSDLSALHFREGLDRWET